MDDQVEYILHWTDGIDKLYFRTFDSDDPDASYCEIADQLFNSTFDCEICQIGRRWRIRFRDEESLTLVALLTPDIEYEKVLKN